MVLCSTLCKSVQFNLAFCTVTCVFVVQKVFLCVSWCWSLNMRGLSSIQQKKQCFVTFHVFCIFWYFIVSLNFEIKDKITFSFQLFLPPILSHIYFYNVTFQSVQILCFCPIPACEKVHVHTNTRTFLFPSSTFHRKLN